MHAATVSVQKIQGELQCCAVRDNLGLARCELALKGYWAGSHGDQQVPFFH